MLFGFFFEIEFPPAESCIQIVPGAPPYSFTSFSFMSLEQSISRVPNRFIELQWLSNVVESRQRAAEYRS
jgi:hypothetical protein